MHAVETSNSGRATCNRCSLITTLGEYWFIGLVSITAGPDHCYWVTETQFVNHRWFTIGLKCATRTQVYHTYSGMVIQFRL